jgi:hypothetical protein
VGLSLLNHLHKLSFWSIRRPVKEITVGRFLKRAHPYPHGSV